jgi:hypothetical protein
MRAYIVVTAWGLRHRCHSCYPIINHRERRLVHESVRVEPEMCRGVEGAFGMGPLACIPNTRHTLVLLSSGFIKIVKMR